MSGRLSALWTIVSFLPYILGAFASGYITEHLPPSQTFVLVAALTLLIALLGLWKPRSVFNHTYDQPQAKGADFLGDVKRLLKHRAVYPAVLIMCMFQFAPGLNTPLQYYLTNELHASDAVFSYFTGIFLASFIPVLLLYGYLCRKVALNKLLWYGMIITVPQMSASSIPPLGKSCAGAGGADGSDGRHCRGGNLRSCDEIVPARVARYFDDDG